MHAGRPRGFWRCQALILKFNSICAVLPFSQKIPQLVIGDWLYIPQKVGVLKIVTRRLKSAALLGNLQIIINDTFKRGCEIIGGNIWRKKIHIGIISHHFCQVNIGARLSEEAIVSNLQIWIREVSQPLELQLCTVSLLKDLINVNLQVSLSRA